MRLGTTRIAVRVQLLDISLSGIFLAGQTAVLPGARATLQTTLGTQPFATEVVIRRYQPGAPDTSGPRGAGTMFISIDDQTQQRLERFLARRAG